MTNGLCASRARAWQQEPPGSAAGVRHFAFFVFSARRDFGHVNISLQSYRGVVGRGVHAYES